MGFRNPIRSATVLDTGGSGQRVQITGNGGAEGGGAVLLYPNAGLSPGRLEAGTDELGRLVALQSPPDADTHLRTALYLRSVPTGRPGEGARLHTDGDVVIAAPAVRLEGAELLRGPRPLYKGTDAGSGFWNNPTIWTDYGIATPDYRRVEILKTSGGLVVIEGTARVLVNLAAGSSPNSTIGTLLPGFRPRKRLTRPAIAGNAFARVDVEESGRISLQFTTAALAANGGWCSLFLAFIAQEA